METIIINDSKFILLENTKNWERWKIKRMKRFSLYGPINYKNLFLFLEQKKEYTKMLYSFPWDGTIILSKINKGSEK